MSKIGKKICTGLCVLVLLAAFAVPCLAADGPMPELEFENCQTVLLSPNYIVAIREDGTLRIEGTEYIHREAVEAAEKLENVVSLCETAKGFAALRADGSVVEIFILYYDEPMKEYDWTGVEELVSCNYALLGRRYDGSVYVSDPMDESEEEAFSYLEPVRSWKNIRHIDTVRFSWYDGSVFAFGEDGEFYYTEWEGIPTEERPNPDSIYSEFLSAMETVDGEDDLLIGTNILVVGDLDKPENCYVFHAEPYGGDLIYIDSYSTVVRNQLAEFKEAGVRPIDIIAHRGEIMFLLDDGTVTCCLNAEQASFVQYYFDQKKDWSYLDWVHEPIQYPEDWLDVYSYADTSDLDDVIAMITYSGPIDYCPYMVYFLRDGTMITRGIWCGDPNFDLSNPTAVPAFELTAWKDIRVPSVTADKTAPRETVVLGSWLGEEIEWLVLDEQDGKQLLLSKECIDCRPMFEGYGYRTWENSHLREWLNEEFLQEAFTDEERELLVRTKLQNKKNPAYRKTGGKDTVDTVFVLSIQEAEEYFADNGSRAADPTDYAMDLAIKKDTARIGWWWLRSNGMDYFYFAGVADDGGIFYGGYNEAQYGYVRPAVWIEK